MRYEPHLSHYIFPILAVVVAAITCYLFPGWETILSLIVVSIISLMMSYFISVKGKIQSEESYWMEVGRMVEQLRSAEPEIWEALGFKSPPKHASLEIHRKEVTQPGSPFYTTQYVNVPVSPATLQTFADGILSGRRKLSEGYWKGIIPGPKYRDFQDWMEELGLIAKVNPQAATQGYILTESGEDWLLKFASASVSSGGGDGYVRKIPVRADEEVTRNSPPI